MRSKYPNVCVAYSAKMKMPSPFVERVQRALREAGVPTAEVKAFTSRLARATIIICWKPICGR
jgi:hypothetical protein